jgi:hypothetical protein
MVREPTEGLSNTELDEVTLAKMRLRAVSERHSTSGGVTRLLLPDRRSGSGSSLLKIAGVAAAAVVAGVVLARYPGVRRAAATALSEQLLGIGRRRD